MHLGVLLDVLARLVVNHRRAVFGKELAGQGVDNDTSQRRADTNKEETRRVHRGAGDWVRETTYLFARL